MGFGQRVRIAVGALMLALAVGFAQPALAATLDAAGAARRDAAVGAARAGDYQTAFAALDQLQSEFPDDLSLLYDQITVHAWAEDDATAVAFATALAPADTPRYTQLAVAKSARNIGEFEAAAIWYDAAIARNSEDTDALAGRLLTAADAGDRSAALALIDSTAASARQDANLQLARAYALRIFGESMAALEVYDAILDADPDHVDALRGKALVLRAMLLPTQALALAAEHPGILSQDETERLRADEAAIRARLAARTPYPEPGVYVGQDRSLAYLEEQLAAATTTAARNTLLLDHVVALSDANQPEAAIAEFESLPESANREQAYVLTAAANAYLEIREPETALELLERALAIEPGNIQARFALVYAWLDLDRYEEAYAVAAELANEFPMARPVPGTNLARGNENRMRAEILAGISDADGNQLEAAQTRLEDLLSAAPNNGELRQELANVYRWRGWLDRSLDQYRQILTTNDDLLSARVGYAHAQLDARNYREVDATLAELSATYGRDPGVQQLAERWRVHNQRELFVTASTGDSTGPVSGANNYTIDMSWYSAPIGYRYRALVTTHDAYAEYPEGEARRRRLGAGVELRLPRVTATGQISASRDGGHAGFSGISEYRASDFWTLDAGLELDSDAGQLRAHRLGIEADRAYLGARFAPSELASGSFGFDRVDYSDANTHETLSADGRYRVLNRPRSRLDATGSVALARAATSEVPYFSPTEGRTLMLGLEHELRLHRRYQREIRQTIGAGTGRYAQQGFATGSIWSLRYRIDWSISQRHSLSLEAQRLGQFFDGRREHTTIGAVSLNSRF